MAAMNTMSSALHSLMKPDPPTLKLPGAAKAQQNLPAYVLKDLSTISPKAPRCNPPAAASPETASILLKKHPKQLRRPHHHQSEACLVCGSGFLPPLRFAMFHDCASDWESGLWKRPLAFSRFGTACDTGPAHGTPTGEQQKKCQLPGQKKSYGLGEMSGN
ncbi:unnamed protein product [Symbiodinium natans]|uniref:Uncharacterized protein n=1 Tax=Symbiodinium natans TaxID=878477 RepID=A0A812LUK4_9DINO|nr:unnamed protein product [Symbiodinium natans]